MDAQRVPRLAVLLLGLACAFPAGTRALAAPEEDGAAEITRKELKESVRRFAHDDLEGREAGTAGCDQAADWIAAEFLRLGLEPVGGESGYFQPFTSPKGTRVLASTSLEADDATGKTSTFALGEEFAPIDVSAAGDVTGPAVFVGYGISAPDMGYDDYAGIDARGKVAVALRYAPRHEDARRSPFAPPDVMMRVGTFSAKADAAAAHGALALIVVNGSGGPKSDDELRPAGGSTTGKLPVVHMTWRAARKLGTRIGIPFTRRQRAIDGKLAPESEECPGSVLRVRVDLQPDVRHMKNVVGLLRPDGAAVTGGAGPEAGRARETIVIGAHYDHVGRGHFGSLATADGVIHNGADDNASGTTALLEIAGHLASRRSDLRRRVLFLAFSGEELGLLGSKHYVRSPLVPLADTVAMLNLDMVGRLDKNRLFVGGTGTSPVWPEMIERLNKETGRFELTAWPGGKAPSDHASFYEADKPVLFFFTGLHSDYHRPSDDWETLEYAGLERIARFAAQVALDVSALAERPQFTRCDAGGFTVGPYSGIAVEQREDGVYVAHVDKKSPAQQAGFKAGDRIVAWGGAAVADTNRYNDLASKAQPGDKVDVDVLREGRARTLKLKLGRT